MTDKKNETLSVTSIIIGVLSVISILTYFLAALSFFSLLGLLLAIIARGKIKSGLTKAALIVNIITTSIFLFYIAALNYSDYKSSKTVYEYYLPKGYTGWTIIQENRKDAPPIPFVPNFPGERYLIIFPDSGKIVTSSQLNDWHTSKYFWYDEKTPLSLNLKSPTAHINHTYVAQVAQLIYIIFMS